MIRILANQIPWYGKHSGYYSQVVKYAAPWTDQVYLPKRTWLNRILGKAYAVRHGTEARDQAKTWVEVCFARSVRRHPEVVHHVLAIEEHLPMLRTWEKAPTNLVGTIHFPRSSFKEADLEDLRRLSSAIVLYRRNIEFYESLIGSGRVRFVYHGVDTDFFRPTEATQGAKRSPRLFFTGQYYRDTDALVAGSLILLQRYSELELDLAIPPLMRGFDVLAPLRRHPRVIWHEDVPDEELAALYANATALFLPMQDSGANNAVVEAIACGCPIVTNDVGGIRDYGGGTIYDLARPGDVQDLVALAASFIEDDARRQAIQDQLREFAVEQLAWPKSIAQHLEAYRQLADVAVLSPTSMPRSKRGLSC